MAILKILQYPDERLHTIARPVRAVNDATRKLIQDMAETMYSAPGIGLAATQVDVHLQIIVMDLGDREGAEEGDEEGRRNPRVFVNPEIVWSSEALASYEEGCLSVPEIYDDVERPAQVKIRYLNYTGALVEEDADGLYAVCIQHEMDHLKGVLFIDHLSRLKRERAIKSVKKAARAA